MDFFPSSDPESLEDVMDLWRQNNEQLVYDQRVNEDELPSNKTDPSSDTMLKKRDWAVRNIAAFCLFDPLYIHANPPN